MVSRGMLQDDKLLLGMRLAQVLAQLDEDALDNLFSSASRIIMSARAWTQTMQTHLRPCYGQKGTNQRALLSLRKMDYKASLEQTFLGK